MSSAPAKTGQPTAAATPTMRVRAPLDKRFIAACIALPIALGFVASTGLRNNVENDLTHRVNLQLGGNGLGNATPTVDGRNVTVKVPAGVPTQRVIDVVKGVEGVGDVQVSR